jgi:HK97 gp10 family phage protein
MRLNVKLKGFDQVLNNIQDYQIDTQANVQSVIQDTALKIQANAKLRTPVDSGTLKRSIETELAPDGMSAVVGTNVEYAPHVEFGTAPHKITVKDAGVLSNGKEVFGKEVDHPGTPATPFLFPAFEEEQKDFLANLEKVLGGKL